MKNTITSFIKRNFWTICVDIVSICALIFTILNFITAIDTQNKYVELINEYDSLKVASSSYESDLFYKELELQDMLNKLYEEYGIEPIKRLGYDCQSYYDGYNIYRGDTLITIVSDHCEVAEISKASKS